MDYTERFITVAPLRSEVEAIETAAARLRGQVAALLVKLNDCGDSAVGRAQIRKTHPRRILEILGDAEQAFYDLDKAL